MKHSDVISPSMRGEIKNGNEIGLLSLKLLDTASDRELDDLCKLAAHVCNVEKVYICLFEKLPGEIGFNYNLNISEHPYNLELFDLLAERPEEMIVIPDILDDSRFTELSTSKNYDTDRFIISISLTNPDNRRLGLLTLFEQQPGHLSSAQHQAIQTVARQVENLLNLRKTNNELSSQQKQFRRTVERSPNIVYRFSEVPGESYHSPRTEEILGYSTKELNDNPDMWRDLIHPQDLAGVDRAVYEARQGTPIDISYRIRTKSGEWRWLHDRSVNIIDENGNIYIEGVASDVTRQKQNEETLVAQAGYIESLLSAMPDLIFVINKEGIFLEVKAGNKEDLLQPENQIMGQHISDVLDVDLSNRFAETIKEATEERYESIVEYKLTIDGKEKVFEARVSPFGNEKVIVLIRNVTQERAVFEKLRVSEEAFRGNFENAAVGMTLVDSNGNWLKVNQTICDTLGYREEEFLNLTYKDITFPEDLEKDVAFVTQILDGTIDHYQMEKRFLHKNGSVINGVQAVSTVKDSEGEILYYISQVIDITPLKNAELDLANALAKNQAILDSSVNTAIIGTDLNGVIQSFNTGAENLTGYRANDVIGEKTPKLFHLSDELKSFSNQRGIDRDGFKLLISSAYGETSELSEWTYVRKDGSHIPVQLSVSLIKTGEDSVNGYLVMATDISSIKKAEYELKQLVDLTQGHNDRLKNFAGIVSHNLRNHAGNIDGLLNLLEEEQQDIVENEYFSYLKQASGNLVNTIKNLSDITHLNEVDKSKMESINLNEYIDKAIQDVSALAKKEQVKIIHKPESEERIYGVPAYLDSIVLNFITNGIKYRSDQRESFVKLTTSTDEDYTVLAVEDNGLGIDLEKHGDKLYGQYNTFHDHPDSRGIGLFITKNQVDAMGGKIKVESEPDRGTTFRIYFRKSSA